MVHPDWEGEEADVFCDGESRFVNLKAESM